MFTEPSSKLELIQCRFVLNKMSRCRSNNSISGLGSVEEAMLLCLVITVEHRVKSRLKLQHLEQLTVHT